MTALPELPSRKAIIERASSEGQKIVAALPVHYPRALVRAFGFLPVEVWGPPGRDTASADAHLQAYTCSVVRSGLSFLLDRKLEVADAVIVPHTCDSLQGLASLVIDFVKPAQPLITLYYPRHAGPAAMPFLVEELRKIGEALGAISQRWPSDDDLQIAIDREESADAALASLYHFRLDLDLRSADFYRLIRSREYLPAETFEPLARHVLDRRRRGGGGGPSGRVPIMISGIMPEPMAVLEVLEEAGGTIVADDLACGSRRLYASKQDADPYRRMAARLLSAAMDPTRGSTVQARADYLVELARRSGAKVAVFYEVKFCEPEQFYLPLSKAALAAAGVRSTLVEVDICDELPGQVITRLEAMLEAAS